ncbi:MAG TPA: hypothetical protein VJI98_00960 [Candidatus Nanoarchaeia archaeon]|nr:hypothetical protein [Candidatus Nanoarchaeia archaeon]
MVNSMDSLKLNQLVKDIKKKKELSSLDDDFVKEHLIQTLNKNHKMATILNEKFIPRSKHYSEIIKAVRSDLRKVYGLFREDKIKIDFIQELLKDPRNKRLINRVLETHSSTRERLPYYEELYRKIFAITGKPKIILDLGCGINPFSLIYMKFKGIYYAYDVSKIELNQINLYFKSIKQSGKAKITDITKWNKFPKADIAFLFKMTDMIDRGKGHKGTEEMIRHLPVKYLVVSFPTLTMSGKLMTAPRRNWMEWLCNRLGYHFKIIEMPNELFYIMEK